MELGNIELDSLVLLKLLKGDADFGQLIGVDNQDTAVITNCIPGEGAEMVSFLEQLNYESNIIGIYGSIDLKSLVELQIQKQQEMPGSFAIWIEEGKLTAFKISAKYLEAKSNSLESAIERIPIKVKNLGLANAFLGTVDTQPAKHSTASIRQSLENLISLSENFQQESWKLQNYYKNLKKNRSEPFTEQGLTAELMLQNCFATQ